MKDEKIEKIELKNDRLNFFRFKNIKDKVLMTNDFGNYSFLTKEEFRNLLEGKMGDSEPKMKELKDRGFIKTDLNVDKALTLYRKRNASIFYGPFLHIMVMTLRCNYKCVYCQASAVDMNTNKYDMTIDDAKKTVDFIFTTPSPVITIEFQGGEPLVNWPAVKFVTEYTRQKEKETGKKAFLALVSNLSLMDEEKFKFFMDNGVGLCTSLDGPEELHNMNRPYPGQNSYKETVKWIERIKDWEKEKAKEGIDIYLLSALLTVSRRSLKFYKEIIDEYLKHGFNGIHLRSLSNLGYSATAKNTIGYSTEEFLDFWKKSLDYIIDINKSGTYFMERGSQIILKKIIKAMDPGYVDLKSPCGAVIDQVLYNYDGKIFTCDEGRMCGGDTFQIGKISGENSTKKYNDLAEGDKVKTMVVASTLDNTSCDNCAYKPYCGICPIVNYMETGSMTPQIQNTSWCKRHKAMIDYLFEKLQDPEIYEIFKSWTEDARTD